MNCLKLGIEKSKFQDRKDSMNLIKALEGLAMKAGEDFPQGDKILRAEDHQAFVPEFIFEVKGSAYTIKQAVAGEKTLVPPACKFAS
jgi:branched-chain amino acid transport system substrate-binding protein